MNINFEHALEIYKLIKTSKNPPKDISELYFTIVLLGDAYLKEISEDETKALVKKK